MRVTDAGGGDAEIVRRVKSGDRDAYRELVQRYQDTLYRYAYGFLGDSDAAADVVQASFVHAFTRLDTLRDDGSYGGWVYRMCVNRCRDELKSRRRRDTTLDAAPAAALTSPDATDDEVHAAEMRRALMDAMSSLNAEHREAFVMKHIEERSYDEMAALLGASVSALKMRVLRAREALRAALQEVV